MLTHPNSWALVLTIFSVPLPLCFIGIFKPTHPNSWVWFLQNCTFIIVGRDDPARRSPYGVNLIESHRLAFQASHLPLTREALNVRREQAPALRYNIGVDTRRHLAKPPYEWVINFLLKSNYKYTLTANTY